MSLGLTGRGLVEKSTCTSSLYTSIYRQVEPEFDMSREVATLGLSLFVVGLGLGPMILGPLSEVSDQTIVPIILLDNP